ncbi:MAG: hypothetical protein IT553_05370 [Sphingomonadaceae bacterium]|nr:hypothetical protein [Sphingomonadaceae bacterium]
MPFPTKPGAMIVVGTLSMVLLAACQPSAPTDPAKAAASARAAQSRSDPRIPGGIPLFLGRTGQITEFEILDAGQGKIATYSVDARPWDIRDFYEAEGLARGYEVIGRVNGGLFQSVDMRRLNGAAPRTFSVMAVHKGEFTNVTLNFDVTPP